MSKEAMKLAQELRALADRFSEGWHEGIKIDASDIVLLSDAAEALAEQPAQPQQEPVAERFEKMHANGDVWITTIAAAAIARNPSPQPAQQEPEEEPQPDGVVMGFTDDGKAIVDHDGLEEGWVLYTSPPAQRKPLTHEQAKSLVAKYGNDPLNLVFQTEAAHGIKGDA